MRQLEKIAFLDAGLGPLLGGALGGAGGYALGKGVINPLLEHKKRSIINKMLSGEELISKLDKGKTVAPIAAATIGALLLAALAANRAKKQERERLQDMLLYQQVQQGDMQGFSPDQQISFGSPNIGY